MLVQWGWVLLCATLPLTAIFVAIQVDQRKSHAQFGNFADWAFVTCIVLAVAVVASVVMGIACFAENSSDTVEHRQTRAAEQHYHINHFSWSDTNKEARFQTNELYCHSDAYRKNGVVYIVRETVSCETTAAAVSK